MMPSKMAIRPLATPSVLNIALLTTFGLTAVPQLGLFFTKSKGRQRDMCRRSIAEGERSKPRHLFSLLAAPLTFSTRQ